MTDVTRVEKHQSSHLTATHDNERQHYNVHK